jgi:hypothetical protein
MARTARRYERLVPHVCFPYTLVPSITAASEVAAAFGNSGEPPLDAKCYGVTGRLATGYCKHD